MGKLEKQSSFIKTGEHGGARPGAGRREGVRNKRTQEMIELATRDGVSPLEYMLQVLRDEDQPPLARFEAAKAAAPYVHPRLASIEANVKSTMSQEDALEALAALKAAADAAER